MRRPRTTALALIAPLALVVSVAGPATAGILAASPAGSSPTPALTSTMSATAMSSAMAMGSMSPEAMASMTSASPTGVSFGDRPGSTQGLPKIRGEVGPGYTISINKDSVPAGKYKFIVNDMGTIHNFHLTGAGVDESTGVSSTGKVTWKLKLKEGTYTAVCDPHSTSMRTTLEVTS